MFRLAEGGSAQRFGFDPDITCLGKWIGGGLPVGAIVADAKLMEIFDPLGAQPVYHGGSFNGNLLSSVTGRVSLEHFDAATIAAMDARAAELRAALEAGAAELGLPFSTVAEGSIMGIYVTDSLARHDGHFMAGEATQLLHLAALTHGVFLGPGGEIALSSVVSGEALELARTGLLEAMGDVARLTDSN
jgi:glutamate-1-semialdehyde 2,1-aminomutase